MSTQTLLDAALAYAARGWPVMPLHDVTQGTCSCRSATCSKPGKHPQITNWPETASSDVQQIRHWWRQWPCANVGILTGYRSSLAVLDVDPRNGGDLALEELEHRYGPLPATPIAISGGKGPHYYFRLDGPLPKFDPGPGLNLQADGALIVAPPSPHISGNTYEWEASSHPDDLPLAPLPDWLKALGDTKSSASVEGVDLPDAIPIVTLQSLHVSHRIKFLIVTGEDPTDHGHFPSRSEALFAVLQALIGAGHDDGTIASVIMNKAHAISEKVWSQQNPKNPRYQDLTRRWVAKEIARAKAKHTQQREDGHTSNPNEDAHHRRNGAAAADPSPPQGLITRCLDDVTAESIQWLWHPYIAVGTLCMLDGDPGIGKSLLSLQLAANLSKGFPFPDQTGQPTIGGGTPYTVLILTREDSVSMTLRPRLDASGADVRRVYHSATWLDPEGKEQAFTLKHLPYLEATMHQLHPRMVILDPIQSFFGDIDMHRANQTRPLLDALAALAEAHRCAIVAIRHPAKPGEGIGKAMHRGLGSVDIIGAARTGLFIEGYPGDDTRALMAQTKSNLGPKGRTLIFSKKEGRFTWERVTRLTDENLAGSGRGPHHQAFLEALLWLEKRLEGGQAWNASDIETEAEEHDISGNVLKRAKKALGVKSHQVRGGAHAGWTWRLPPLALSPDIQASTESSGTTEDTEPTESPDLKSMTYTPSVLSDSQEESEVSGESEESEDSVGEVVTMARCSQGGPHNWLTRSGVPRLCVRCNAEEVPA